MELQRLCYLSPTSRAGLYSSKSFGMRGFGQSATFAVGVLRCPITQHCRVRPRCPDWAFRFSILCLVWD